MILEKGFYKRVFDLILLAVTYILFLPAWIIFWIIIPMAIWLEDQGKIFYIQERIGKGGRIFKVLKFRTMIVDADKLGPAWTVAEDKRVTKIGKLLRYTALDELPQIINILKGQMNFVGPRPLDLSEHELCLTEDANFAKRLVVPPGLTSLADALSVSDDHIVRLAYDLEYIKKMNLALDIKIILLSIHNTFLGRWDRRKNKSSYL